jgi:hypothetical protein
LLTSVLDAAPTGIDCKAVHLLRSDSPDADSSPEDQGSTFGPCGGVRQAQRCARRTGRPPAAQQGDRPLRRDGLTAVPGGRVAILSPEPDRGRHGGTTINRITHRSRRCRRVRMCSGSGLTPGGVASPAVRGRC